MKDNEILRKTNIDFVYQIKQLQKELLIKEKDTIHLTKIHDDITANLKKSNINLINKENKIKELTNKIIEQNQA